MIVILSYISFKTLKKGYQAYQMEKMENQDSQIVVIDGISLPIEIKNVEIDGIELPIISEDYERAVNDYQGDKPRDKFIYMGVLVLISAVIAGFTLTRNLLNKCGTYYWLHYGLQFLTLLLIGSGIAIFNIKNYQKKVDNNYYFLKGDIKWDKLTCLKYTLISSATGLVSTFLGIGGGMLIVPALIKLGLLPEVVAAVNSVTTFYSSVSSSLQFIGSGRILPFYSLYFFFISMIGTFCGLKIAKLIITRLKKRSYLIFSLGIIIALSTVMLFITGTLKLVENIDNPRFTNFNSFCE